MASLSAHSVSEPLGLTLGNQCALETVKRDTTAQCGISLINLEPSFPDLELKGDPN